MRQIIAIDGGGFGRNPSDRKIEKYIVDQQEKRTQMCALSQLLLEIMMLIR